MVGEEVMVGVFVTVGVKVRVAVEVVVAVLVEVGVIVLVGVGDEVAVKVDVQGVLLAFTQGGTGVAVKVAVGAAGVERLEDFLHDWPTTKTVKRTDIPIHLETRFICHSRG